jgi:nitrite reductase (NADH) small subunit
VASSTSASAASASRPEWVAVCRLDHIPPDAGVCALVDGAPVAIFRAGDRVLAIGDRDPFTGASVLSRGIVGDRGGVLKVASPLHKQSFALETGVCLDDPEISVPVYACRVVDGVVEVCGNMACAA